MSQQQHITATSRHVAYGAVAAVLLLLGASPAHAQWANKPAPLLPRPVLDQAISGSVVLALVFQQDGSIRDTRIVRSSGNSGLDDIARQGAMKWRLNPASLQPSDMTSGRQHMIKFYQNANVSRRVEPFSAFWKEL